MNTPIRSRLYCGGRNQCALRGGQRFSTSDYPEDALTVTKHLKRTIGARNSDWFGPKEEEEGR